MPDLSRFRSQPGVGHTPGPWVIDEFYEPEGFYKIRAAGEGVCHVFAFVPKGREPRCDADARLIAAAPDLLAVLTEIESVARLTVTADHTHCVMAINLITDRARIALAKTES